LSRKDGVDVCAVRDRGMLEASDDEVLDKAFEEDRVLVTANVCGFEKLAHARELHAGIVLLEQGVGTVVTGTPSRRRQRQRRS